MLMDLGSIFRGTSKVMRSSAWLAVLCGVLALFIATGPCSAQQYYGAKWGADELANTVIGNGISQGDYRFRATHGGTLAAVHTFFICKNPGYGAGTGGSYRVDLESDDGTASHFASGKVLATTAENSPESLFTTQTFSSPATLVAGTLYHVVYTNKDANPSANYCSLDMMWWGDPAPATAQPTVPNTDWSHLYNQGTVSIPSWHLRSEATPVDGGNYMPTMQLVYGDGTVYGNGYMESWIFSSRKTISGNNQARETITAVTGTQVVSSITVRLRHDSGNDPLRVTLRNSTGVMESGAISAGSFVAAGNAGDNWVTYHFSAPRTLVAGDAYQLVLSSPSSSAYSIFPLRKGATHNFSAPSYFADGFAQYSADGSSCNNWPDENATPSAEGDLQFFFAVSTGNQVMPPTNVTAAVQ
jgi:hypothetical protein